MKRALSMMLLILKILHDFDIVEHYWIIDPKVSGTRGHAGFIPSTVVSALGRVWDNREENSSC